MTGAGYVRRIDTVLAGVERKEAQRAQKWLVGRLSLMPWRWAAHLRAEHGRRGGLESAAANIWLMNSTEPGRGRLPLSVSDDDIRAAAKEAAQDASDLVGWVAGDVLIDRGEAFAEATPGADWGKYLEAAKVSRLYILLKGHCHRWGIEPAAWVEDFPAAAIRRMTCNRWWLRRLRRAHGKRSEGAAIAGGVVRRGLWPYASQDAVERRKAQRRRNALACEGAAVRCEDTGEEIPLADIVEGSLANPTVKRSELMVRIRGADEYAELAGWKCEFWTLTAPSRFHSQRITGACSEANPGYGEEDEATGQRKPLDPSDGQRYLCRVWSRARAAWKRRGLVVAGLRTAEPHHDGTPHWHLIVYGSARDLRFARRLLRVYAMRDTPDEPGARKHRFNYLKAQGGRAGARYAAKYVAKNIDGYGLDAARDTETGRKISSTVERVDAWAAHWGIRQFQFFGMPPVTAWRVLRRVADEVGPKTAPLERARRAADESDWCEFWRACEAGEFEIVRRSVGLSAYGDAAAPRIAGVVEGGRRAMLPVKDWVIHWGTGGRQGGEGDKPIAAVRGFEAVEREGAALEPLNNPWRFERREAPARAGGFAFPRSGVNNCTNFAEEAARALHDFPSQIDIVNTIEKNYHATTIYLDRISQPPRRL
ncbi:MAG: hypothetical protein H6R10_584 [Rhodocyclaceae bacterium]|nr:hypothetical protein [Rhodocyclaceae bacterium]